MPRLIWAPTALRDISRLHGFLAGKNPNAARRSIAAIRHGVRLLERHPQAGRRRAEMPEEFREWPIPFGSYGYLALYHYDGEEVVILAVRHVREAGY